MEHLEEMGERNLRDQKRSALLAIAHFMQRWQEEKEGFTRIFALRMDSQNPTVSLSRRCLDPGTVSGPILERCHSAILMSGTLTPTAMYRDLLGFEKTRTLERTFENPFPKHNALHWIIPETTTKYAMRSDAQFQRIAAYVTDIVDRVPGSSAVFFPSYELRDIISNHLETDKPLFREERTFTKKEKAEFISAFKQCKKDGAVLLGAAAGSFGEGIDLPGDFLQCVIIVGLPLARPDAETSELIAYYDKKFGQGWDYGYIYPAFNKTLQNAGRCIRSETDRGIIVYLDERYTWRNYFKCFPQDLNMSITTKTQIVDMFFE
jgi:DNA excision repair protein ERCC-2